MKFIPTTAEKVAKLRKGAKDLKRSKPGKYSEWLERLAKEAGYHHWHHVMQCAQTMPGSGEIVSLITECARAVDAARQGVASIALTGPDGLDVKPWLLFSTLEKDAWLLDINEKLASCLLWHGEDQSATIHDLPNDYRIAWDGGFELSGTFFRVETSHPVIGTRAIGGYPVKEIREFTENYQQFESRFIDIFVQPDAVDLTNDTIAELVRAGWDEKRLREMAAEGGRYSPSRNTIRLPTITGGFDDDDDLDPDDDEVGKGGACSEGPEP